MPRRILVVEDSRTQAEQLQAVLANAGYQVEVAFDGEAALRILEARPADVVISDIVMPGAIDGYEVCRRIKNAPSRRNPPVVLLTSLSDPSDIIHALECGADNFLRKPYDPGYLLERLQVLFATRELRAKDRVQFGMKVLFSGREVTINSEHQQVLDLLISTFEEAVIQNRELRQREEELRLAKAELDRYAGALEQRLKSVLEAIPDALFSVDSSLGDLLYISPAAVQLFGYTAEEMLADAQLWRRSAHPGDLPGLLAVFNLAIESALPQTYECRFRTRDGGCRWLQLNVAAVPESSSGRVRLDGVAHDVTRRKTAEEARSQALAALQASEERFRGVYENTALGLYRTTPDGRIVMANPALIRMLGYAAFDELADRNLEQSGYEPDYPRAEFRRRIESEGAVTGLESAWTRDDGSTVWVRESARLIRDAEGRPQFYDGTVEDVTERIAAEQALKASETRFRSLIEHSMDQITIMGADGRLTYVSPSATRLLGYGVKELLGQVGFEFVHPDDVARVQAAFAKALGGDAAEIREVFRFRHRDGSWRAFESVVTNLLGEPTVAGLVINSRDITERRQAEDLLRRSEADYRGLVDHAPLGVYRSTRAGRFLTVNAALVSMLGYHEPAELLRLDLARDVYTDPEERERLIREGRSPVEVQWKRRDGTRIVVQISSRAIPPPQVDGECFEGMVQDVTDQRSLENQFRQAQRLEAIGRLAGGVAHDFNNVLTAITGYCELLLDSLDGRDPRRQDVEEIRQAAQRAAALTRQLLAFSRKQVLQTRVLNLNTLVQTLQKMLQRLIGEDVKLEFSPQRELGAVRADAGQIEQVILNLAVNSRDAMPDGGRLTIETRNVELPEAYALEHTGVVPGRYVMLAVTDTGIGMDPETMSHIFEPFFTTKEQGKGTGLGLATVYGIVKQSGGNIWVYSESGRGTTFKVYLPRVDEAVEGAGPAPSARAAAGGSETVLLAEDDPAVQEIAAAILSQKGYRVLRVSDGESALEAARAEPGEIHLLVTDMIMPGMTGREVAEALTRDRPDLRVVYMSGYTDDAVVRHGVLEQGMSYLQKPFTPGALVLKVREVLDAPVPSGKGNR